MGILNKIFGSSTGSDTKSKEEKILPWIALNDLQQLKHIEKKSNTKTQVIFKHSTRCGISKMVMNQFVDSYELTEQDLDLYYLDLLDYRDVSNEVGYKFQVMHESPQLLVIKNGVVVTHASHGAINQVDLSRFV
ncbi:bacillithiol system redox-active protein YtxJ [Ichthyenterobacterium magnum]|uniref:Bacillithiol system protein YtxJ n=1 Tax=Ichthyenterobacterium magnum TaxID=1230530 RepID=A0A420DLQ1_9FLAO|nr:bacillithiol system redox-active protein YtxJ [Ichthyenterobacterium magnum]RKE95115.1 bacillithiol system protein YtxJ [Ichthyenterobacterium magnum]